MCQREISQNRECKQLYYRQKGTIEQKGNGNTERSKQQVVG